MSSGQRKKHYGFNPIQIKDGMVVRLGKDGRIREILGKYGEYKKNGDKRPTAR
jgi:hypothetical protein